MIDTLTVSVVNPKMIEAIWPKVKDLIKVALEYSNHEMTLSSIYDRLISREMALVLAMENERIVAALTLENNTFPSGKRVLTITTAGGADMHLWLDEAIKVCINIAVKHKCEELYIIGREGWSKALKTKGFKTAHTVLTRKVGI